MIKKGFTVIIEINQMNKANAVDQKKLDTKQIERLNDKSFEKEISLLNLRRTEVSSLFDARDAPLLRD